MDFRTLDDFLDSLPLTGVPACDMSVWINHREVHRHSAAAGPLPATDGLYYLYSCSKPITVAAALTLMEQGKFLLDTPVADILPEYGSLRVLSQGGTATVPARRPLRMRELFTMTSGFGYDTDSPVLAQVREATGGRCPTRETVRRMAEIPLHFEPSERFLYGLSLDIMAACVEVLAGEPFADYVRRVIFEPLGMTRSTFLPGPREIAALEPQYRLDRRTGTAAPAGQRNAFIFGPEYASGGAGAVSCVQDMARFCDALAMGGIGASGARILSPASVELMRTPMLTDAQRSTFVWKELGSSYSYGLGVRVHDNPAGGALSPLGEFGWGGAAGALEIICPERGLSAYFAMHVLNSDLPYMHPRLINILFACLDEP